MSLSPYIHAITPGDHFSPRTGSAVPTVVDGLSAAAPPGSPRARVIVARGTYADRYASADVVEYEQHPTSRRDRYLDAARGHFGLARSAQRRDLAGMVAEQAGWAPSVVLAHNLPQLVPLVDAARHAPVLYAHNQLLRTYSTRETERTLRHARAIVAVSDSLADQFSGRLTGALSDRLVVVRNGVDCERFRPAEDRRRGDRLEVMVIGRIVRDKGPDVVVSALGRLRRADIALTFVGSQGFDPHAPLSDYERELRARAAALTGPVRFVPSVPRDELASLLRTSDVLVVPSRWPDPCPLTVPEGLASGLAVVASRIGGIPEEIGDAGVLVEPDDPVSLADAIDHLADDEAERARLGRAGREHALTHDWAWAARNLADALRRLL